MLWSEMKREGMENNWRGVVAKGVFVLSSEDHGRYLFVKE